MSTFTSFLWANWTADMCWKGNVLQGLLRVDWCLNGPRSAGNVNYFQPVHIWYVTVKEPLGRLMSLVSGTTRRRSAVLQKWYEFKEVNDLASVNPHMEFGSRHVWNLQG